MVKTASNRPSYKHIVIIYIPNLGTMTTLTEKGDGDPGAKVNKEA